MGKASRPNPLLKEGAIFVAFLVLSTVTTAALFSSPEAVVAADAGRTSWWALDRT